MIRKDSGRSKFISLLVILTMVFSMIMPMGAWAASTDLAHDVAGNTHTFAQLQEGYMAGDITALSVEISTTTPSQANVTATLEGTNASSFEFNAGTTTASMGEITNTTPATFTIKPKVGLTEGTYVATVRIVSDEDVTGITFDITQVVTAAPPASYTLTLNGTGLTTTPAAGSIAAGTSVTVTVAPPVGQMVNIFTVGGVDKKAELVNNQYTFNMPSENTTVVVSYIESNYIIDISEANVLLVGDYAFTLTNVDEAIYNLNNYIHAAQSVKNTGTKDAPQYHIYLHVGNGMWYDLVTNPDLDPTKKLSESEINLIQSKYGDPGKYVYINMEYVIDPS